MHEQRPSLLLIEIPLAISALLYGMIGGGILIFFTFLMDSAGNSEKAILGVVFGITAVFCFVFAAFICLVVSQLRRRKKWAWIAAIVLGAMYAPSAFIVLGVPILIGCFKTDVNAWFNGPRKPLPMPNAMTPPNDYLPPQNSHDPYQPPRTQ